MKQTLHMDQSPLQFKWNWVVVGRRLAVVAVAQTAIWRLFTPFLEGRGWRWRWGWRKVTREEVKGEREEVMPTATVLDLT
jgi:hypothetical protein